MKAKNNSLIIFLLLSLSQFSNTTHSQDGTQNESEQIETEKAKTIDVQDIRSRYWDRGRQNKLGVVQNRKYTKEGRWSVGMLGGLTFGDPFLDTKQYGLDLGYNFTETFSLSLIGWKYKVSGSSANDKLNESNKKANTNEPNYYIGTEAAWSLIYGKVSLIGKKIIYYDLSFLTGLGATKNEKETAPTPHIGIGQRYFLNQNLSFRLDYRLMYYRETIIEKEIESRKGQSLGKRSNFNNTLIFGIDFMFD